MNKNKLFEIERFHMLTSNVHPNEDIIRVEYYKEEWDEYKTVDIPQLHFERWLERTDRLERTMEVRTLWQDEYDYDEKTMNISLEDYWNEDVAIIRKDLYEYLVIHNMDVLTGIMEGINTITQQRKLAS